MPLLRLNKYLSTTGVASRRHADDLISQGKVKVNDKTASLGDKVNPEIDLVTVKGRPIRQTLSSPHTYLAINKPLYVLSSTTDDHGRSTVIDLVSAAYPHRLYPIGRLDYRSSGLLILTDDGDLTLKLTHPRYHLPKTYKVTVSRPLSTSQLNSLATGIRLDDVVTLPAKVRPLSPTAFEIILREGRNRQIRRMVEALGNRVVTLHRLSIGSLTIGNLKPGEFRPLTSKEIAILKSA